jgi:hypothetical protein
LLEADAITKFNTPVNLLLLPIFLKSEGLNADTIFGKSDEFVIAKLEIEEEVDN